MLEAINSTTLDLFFSTSQALETCQICSIQLQESANQCTFPKFRTQTTIRSKVQDGSPDRLLSSPLWTNKQSANIRSLNLSLCFILLHKHPYLSARDYLSIHCYSSPFQPSHSHSSLILPFHPFERKSSHLLVAMPPIRRSASKIKSDSPVTKALSDSPIPTVEKSASPVPAPTRRPKVSRSRTAPTKSTKKKKPSRRTCVGCKAAVNDYLFLGWFSKVANDFKEKCLSCRRFDAVNDCLKSHADSDGNLTLEAQIEHIQDQEDQIKAWAVRMKKFAAISGDELMQGEKQLLRDS